MDQYISYLIVSGVVILAALIVLPIAASYLWNRRWRPKRVSQGHAVDKLNGIITRTMRFIFKEEQGSIFAKVQDDPQAKPAKPLPPVMNAITYKKLYLVLLLAAIAFIFLQKPLVSVILIALLTGVIYSRVHPVFKARHATLMRMFEVAASNFKYPRGSDQNPWNWVEIQKWKNITVPSDTIVKFPNTFRSDIMMSRESFEQHFSVTVTDENSWTYEWNAAKNHVKLVPVEHLPPSAPYEGSESFKWNEIPIGIGSKGPVMYDLTASPHVLLAGPTGSGKSVLQRSIVFHCIQHNDMWQFLGVDLKRVELPVYRKYSKTVKAIAVELEAAVELIREVERNMMERFTLMEERGVQHFTMLQDETGKHPKAIMLMIDEAYVLLSMEGAKTDEGKARDQLHGEAVTLLGSIARLGRAAGVHMLVATQRPDAAVIPGELRNNLETRIAAGRLNSTASSMILDSGAGTRLPKIKGRGMLFYNGEYTQFQGYFAQPQWIDGWLENHKEREPALFGLPDDDDDIFGDEEDGIDFVADDQLEFELDAAARSRLETFPEPEVVTEDELAGVMAQYEAEEEEEEAHRAEVDPFAEARELRAARAREEERRAAAEPKPAAPPAPAPQAPVAPKLPVAPTRPVAPAPVRERAVDPATGLPAKPRRVSVPTITPETAPPIRKPITVSAQEATPATVLPSRPARPNFPGRG